MTRVRQLRPSGQIRQSQVVTTFGPGAMVDLPEQAVVIGGLDHWRGDRRPIFEERLGARIQTLLELPSPPTFYAPPIEVEDPRAPASGITAWLFPEWFVSQFEVQSGPFRARRLLHRRDLVDGQHLDRDRKKHRVVPVRFVQACLRGHLADIDWYGFTHEFRGSCRRPLWLEERGTTGDLADIFVRCECGAPPRSLARATRLADLPLGHCGGQRPWLGPKAQERCGEPARFLIRSASNAYFAQKATVISIPDRDAALRKAVDAVWEDFLLYVESLEDLRRERRKVKVAEALSGLNDESVFAEVRRRKEGGVEDRKGIKQAEIEMLLACKDEIGEDAPEGDFYARTAPLTARTGAMSLVDRVVLVHRLREVVAQIGFTRFEDPLPDIDAELKLDVRLGALGRETAWLPAVENRGEGFLVAFRKEAIDAWLERETVKRRGAVLAAGFDAWTETRKGAVPPFPGLPYIMLHSLAHLLITSVSLECGYSASSIRERIYAGEGGYGILLYTGSPDAEGTLGGLVQVGRRFADHLRGALELGRLCSNDPVCAQHRPDNVHEGRFLHGAACHGCLLIAEPSCERRNEFLDRALVVPTVDGAGAEFFSAVEGVAA